MSKKKKSFKAKFARGMAVFTDLVLSAALIGAGVYGAKEFAEKIRTVGTAEITEYADEEPEIDEFAQNYSILAVDSEDIYKGDLILVNNNYAYKPDGTENLIEIEAKNEETDYYWVYVNEHDYQILEPVYQPVADMMHDFIEATEIDNVLIYGAYRSFEAQNDLYQADLAENESEESTLVAKPGFSEHQTGYCFDFTTTPDHNYDGEGEYSWFTDNCCNYGFILRYPEGKEDITFIQYEPWHFRYVGLPHAVFMKRNNMCLEEYIETLRSVYTFGGVHLQITDVNGKNYEVYYVPASDDDITEVHVPKNNNYTISGNNVDGFIVTVEKNDSDNTEEVISDEETEVPENAEEITEQENSESEDEISE